MLNSRLLFRLIVLLLHLPPVALKFVPF